jgi:hypothetical protein
MPSTVTSSEYRSSPTTLAGRNSAGMSTISMTYPLPRLVTNVTFWCRRDIDARDSVGVDVDAKLLRGAVGRARLNDHVRRQSVAARVETVDPGPRWIRDLCVDALCLCVVDGHHEIVEVLGLVLGHAAILLDGIAAAVACLLLRRALHAGIESRDTVRIHRGRHTHHDELRTRVEYCRDYGRAVCEIVEQRRFSAVHAKEETESWERLPVEVAAEGLRMAKLRARVPQMLRDRLVVGQRVGPVPEGFEAAVRAEGGAA